MPNANEISSPRSQVLFEAERTINGDRDQQYGAPAVAFDLIAKYWSVYLGCDVLPKDVAQMMVLMKLAREQLNTKRDNLVDMIGYAALSVEL
ncbi:DUF6378 domain-containing protein [Chrysiogenes arsenatis]|uniref:DUF6378 domain-containing protein n=1 Tax=Chrysiogenes arsenatis TaxID=309797 RepID=UPI0003F6E4FA|nr:DUF6378 domain-containing protein [Chrysiogenes arsenatis]